MRCEATRGDADAQQACDNRGKFWEAYELNGLVMSTQNALTGQVKETYDEHDNQSVVDHTGRGVESDPRVGATGRFDDCGSAEQLREVMMTLSASTPGCVQRSCRPRGERSFSLNCSS